MNATTRVPTVGLFRDDRHRYYWNGNGPMPGATGVLRIIDKPGIANWAKRTTAKAVLDNWDLVGQMRSVGGVDAVVNWLAATPDFQRDTAANLGSSIHRYAEMLARRQRIESAPDEHLPYIKALIGFAKEYGPEYVSLERMVCSLKHGYGGTFDAIAKIGGQTWLIDYKTSKGAYSETAMQLAAYANADFCGLPGDPKKYRIPAIDRYAVLHIRPEQYAKGYSLIEYAVGPAEFQAFLAALELTRWKVKAADVIREPVKVTKEVVAA